MGTSRCCNELFNVALTDVSTMMMSGLRRSIGSSVCTHSCDPDPLLPAFVTVMFQCGRARASHAGRKVDHGQSGPHWPPMVIEPPITTMLTCAPASSAAAKRAQGHHAAGVGGGVKDRSRSAMLIGGKRVQFSAFTHMGGVALESQSGTGSGGRLLPEGGMKDQRASGWAGSSWASGRSPVTASEELLFQYNALSNTFTLTKRTRLY